MLEPALILVAVAIIVVTVLAFVDRAQRSKEIRGATKQETTEAALDKERAAQKELHKPPRRLSDIYQRWLRRSSGISRASGSSKSKHPGGGSTPSSGV